MFMSQKNAMLSESSVALYLSTLRILINGHFQSDAVDKIDNLAKRLISQNEQAIVEKLLPLCGKLATEDDMPGKFMAVVEETLMALVLFSDGMAEGSPKMQVLQTVIKDSVLTKVIEARELPNILLAMNLLRFFALLQAPESMAISVPILQTLSELLFSSLEVVQAD